jgi:hypothetical protein
LIAIRRRASSTFDGSGRRVLIGLTIEETLEFETPDNLSALDEPGGQVARK